MKKVTIGKGSDDNYKLLNCPLGHKSPTSCQNTGCPYWNGYMFENAKYNGFRHYIGSQWRKLMVGRVVVSNYVRCLHNNGDDI